MTNVSKLSDDKLAELAENLAKQRTDIRIQQNDVQAEIDMRRALDSMPESSRRVFQTRLEGDVASSGEAAGGA